ncbi:MAG: D-3-phosphoglycerate dehydrogenase [Polyangiaceae bacterium]|jgi:D-3-phosphoglycerate dehydrogenase|nr:D-3-phosphoglycerate dehydrogenase [Polyangiaceae bacterium]
MRVLVADRLSESSLDEMRTLGVEVSYEPDLDSAELTARLPGFNVLIVRGTEVNKAAFDAGSALNLVIRAGAGVKNIDVATASERGIYVANCPGKNASAVAELTFALIGCLDRRIPDGVASLRAGRWEKNEFARATGLRGRSIGILGLGHVGRAVLKIAQAYELTCYAYSRSLTAARAAELGVTRVASAVELAKVSDILTVHLELSERTRGVVDRKVLSQLKPGSFFINTARDELVDYDALQELVVEKSLRVGLDVLPGEPTTRIAQYRHPLLETGLVYAVPHIGASTDEAQIAIANETVRILRSFLTKGEVPNVVNIAESTYSRYQLVVRHVDQVGALANVLAVLKRHGINVQELDNTVFEGARAACAKIRLSSRPSDACLSEIMAFSGEVLHVDLVTLPNLA